MELGLQETHRKCLRRQEQLSNHDVDYIPEQMKWDGGVGKEETQTSV